MPDASRSLAFRCGVVLLTVGGATLLRLVLWPLLGPDLPLLLYWPAVIIGAWYGGLWPGVLASALSALCACFFLLEPRFSFAGKDRAELAGAGLFALEGFLFSFLCERLQRAMTARRQAEEEAFTAVNQRELWRVTLASIGDAVVVTDARGRVSFLNAVAQQLTGWRQEEACGRDVEEVFRILHEQTREAAPSPVGTALREGRVVVLANHTVLRARDGTERLIEDSAAPIRDEARGVAGSVLVFYDVTERRRLEDQYRQSQKLEAIGRLAGGVAHDFNNLLTAVLGCCDLLLQGLPPGDANRGHVEVIRKAGDRAASLTGRLLAFGRRQLLRPEVLDLNAVAAETAAMLRRIIGEDIDLALDLEPGLGAVRADRVQLEQVLVNLAANARDSMPGGGRLLIQTRTADPDPSYARAHPEARPGPHVLLAVSDSGCGMDEETKKHLFEPFFTTKEVGKGTGLGLATTYSIVEQSGGHIEVDSEPGRGTTVKIYLPRTDQPVSREGPQPFRLQPARRGETVLLVEDDEAVRCLAREVLEGCGYRVLAAGRGDEALALSGGHGGPIHLLVTDVRMPGMDGPRLAEQLRASRPGTRVLYISGYAGDAVLGHGVPDALAPLLPKPFTPAALAGKVREVLDSP